MPAGMKKRSGFTLIELLVVIAIIALLLSILTPALNAVKERARRILCSNRLKQWGIAIHAYNAANGDRMMKIVKRWGGVNFPCYISTILNYSVNLTAAEEAEGISKNEWNAYRINPYIELMDRNYEDTGIVTALVTCPNASGDFMQKWIRENNWEATNPPFFDFIEFAYTYWGGIDEILGGPGGQRSDNALRYLTVDVPSPKRLLMSEILWLTGGGVELNYRYNHGKRGWSWNASEDIVDHTDRSPFPQATGRGQLFGDGRVTWKAIPLDKNLPTHEDLSLLVSGADDGMWNGRDSGWVGDPFDMTFF